MSRYIKMLDSEAPQAQRPSRKVASNVRTFHKLGRRRNLVSAPNGEACAYCGFVVAQGEPKAVFDSRTACQGCKALVTNCRYCGARFIPILNRKHIANKVTCSDQCSESYRLKNDARTLRRDCCDSEEPITRVKKILLDTDSLGLWPKDKNNDNE